MSTPTPLLHVDRLWAFYDQAPVLRGVHLSVAPGELVAVLGRNGSGRSTLAKAIVGLVRTEGTRAIDDQSLASLDTFEIIRLGVAYVPETRDIFPNLNVMQNLQLGQRPGAPLPGVRRWQIEDVLSLFPVLRSRLDTPGGVLSGGEQQMLALGRGVLGNPRLLIVDEPTEGLAPQLVGQVAGFLRMLRDSGIGIVLMEQKLHMAMGIADRIAVMGGGAMVFDGTPDRLREAHEVQRNWLEV